MANDQHVRQARDALFDALEDAGFREGLVVLVAALVPGLGEGVRTLDPLLGKPRV